MGHRKAPATAQRRQAREPVCVGALPRERSADAGTGARQLQHAPRASAGTAGGLTTDTHATSVHHRPQDSHGGCRLQRDPRVRQTARQLLAGLAFRLHPDSVRWLHHSQPRRESSVVDDSACATGAAWRQGLPFEPLGAKDCRLLRGRDPTNLVRSSMTTESSSKRVCAE